MFFQKENYLIAILKKNTVLPLTFSITDNTCHTPISSSLVQFNTMKLWITLLIYEYGRSLHLLWNKAQRIAWQAILGWYVVRPPPFPLMWFTSAWTVSPLWDPGDSRFSRLVTTYIHLPQNAHNCFLDFLHSVCCYSRIPCGYAALPFTQSFTGKILEFSLITCFPSCPLFNLLAKLADSIIEHKNHKFRN